MPVSYVKMLLLVDVRYRNQSTLAASSDNKVDMKYGNR
ncbi:Hypothetical protein Y17_2368 [Pectobacterium wasabiae CFBP 3304]|nr:Hypothetical protein Y17_2368 [Pectobacterium wasabiae CFBP 3304]